ncbi:glucose 1-dehydrogenase [Aureobasidium subglaciale]|nr:glucose 1-dehydrogenase [Aureobasidium subglaciale]
MGKKRVLVGYGVDVDAVAGWINTKDGSVQNGTNVSRGIFGATVGLDRLLKLFEKHDIKATFLWVFQNSGLHGYTHEHISGLSASQQRDVLQKSIEVLTTFTGKKPQGYTAPAWDTSKELMPLLEEFGIVYDHSFMHHDLQPYFAPDSSHQWVETNLANEAATWMSPMTRLKPSKIVEIPANWHVDDCRSSFKEGKDNVADVIQGRLCNPCREELERTHELEKLWLEQFDFAYEEYDSFIFPMSIHPQVSGKPQVIKMHERIINYINKHGGVEWMSFADMAKEFLEGRIAGVEIEGGAET